MTSHDNELDFKFSYLALKLMGKNLYSNVWAALSELVANGLDAQANEVYIYINMAKDKSKSVIEVFDNGIGMSHSDLENKYVSIGRNRRFSDDDDLKNIMGRKGIGKLAALYLSRHYLVSSKKATTSLLTYEMNFSKEKENSNERPQLKKVSSTDFDNKQFYGFEHGTMIRMEDVDLRGYAKISMDSLKNMLSDFFSVESLPNRQKIMVKVISDNLSTDQEFEEVQKSIAFKNMVEILCFDSETHKRLNKKYKNNKFRLPYKKGSEDSFEGETQILLDEIPDTTNFFPKNNLEKHGKIKGWLGIHASIDQKTAIENDDRFKKNKVYNPLKLRVYVRNKLAIDNFLPIINNTQVFAKFIEGEVSYDILDDDDFPDIATTSRQDMDENDGRMVNLAKKLKLKITRLIGERQKISQNMNKRESELEHSKNTTAKSELSKELDDTFKRHEAEREKKLTEKEPSKETYSYIYKDLKETVLKRIKGDLIKDNYKIFFSHSRENKDIVDFFYFLLKSVGVKNEEMFYTSRDDIPEIQIKKDLADISKKTINDENTVIFFYITKKFRESQYCMFEGGAAWATRTQEDFFLTSDDMKFIPEYLKPSNEFLLELKDDSELLAGDFYNKIVQSLNFLIDHINKGRRINVNSEVPLFKEIEFPDKVHFNRGDRPKLDENIIEYWNAFINSDTRKEAVENGFIKKTGTKS
ncbi:ATP-binding protein [Liquorilactobacillus sp.]|uniref:ATP-binding protein n=1 Tax=Liquorilactobacillus sp. TaxID=2767923 RepID=UPI0039EB1DB2